MHEGRGIQDTMTLSVLHISDLHRDPANTIGSKILLESLERDRDHYTTKEDPQIAPPNFIIVSGDIVQGVDLPPKTWPRRNVSLGPENGGDKLVHGSGGISQLRAE